jgi:hypothetical protein
MFVDKTSSPQIEQYIMSSSYSNPVNNNAFDSSDGEEEEDDASIVPDNYFDSSDEEEEQDDATIVAFSAVAATIMTKPSIFNERHVTGHAWWDYWVASQMPMTARDIVWQKMKKVALTCCGVQLRL